MHCIKFTLVNYWVLSFCIYTYGKMKDLLLGVNSFVVLLRYCSCWEGDQQESPSVATPLRCWHERVHFVFTLSSSYWPLFISTTAIDTRIDCRGPVHCLYYSICACSVAQYHQEYCETWTSLVTVTKCCYMITLCCAFGQTTEVRYSLCILWSCGCVCVHVILNLFSVIHQLIR